MKLIKTITKRKARDYEKEAEEREEKDHIVLSEYVCSVCGEKIELNWEIYYDNLVLCVNCFNLISPNIQDYILKGGLNENNNKNQ